MNDLLVDLLHAIDAPQATYAELQRYATGTQPQAFLSAESRRALDHQLCRVAVNVPALAVSSIVERLRIVGFSDPRAFSLYTALDLDQLVPQAFTDALTYGCGYILVWGRNGTPTATVEDPFQCAVLRDPGTREVIAGIKRYRTKTTTEVFVYLPDEVQHWRASSPGAGAGFNLVESIGHNLGVVPLVPIDSGRSEITDLMPLVDALSKVVLDMVIGSHAAGFGRRWVTGIELVEKPRTDDDGNPVYGDDGEQIMDVVNPIDDLVTVPMAVAENPETKFGSFAEPSLAGFETAVRVLVSMIMAVSALPSHYLGVLTAQPNSADSLRASEAALTARAEARQLTFGPAVETVGRLLIAVDTGTADVPLRVQWADAATRSVAQEADAVVKLYQAGLLPAAFALAKLGYSTDEVELIRAAKRAEALDAQGFGTALGGDE